LLKILAVQLDKKLQSVRKELGFTQEVIATKLGIKRAAYAAYEEGRAVPKLSILKQICQLAKIDIDELIGNDLDKVRPSNTHSMGVQIPLIPIKAAAGYQSGFPDEQFVSELPHLNIPTLGRGDYRAFEISGDSMLPLVSGTIVIGERLEKITHVKNGKTYVLVTKNDGIVYKRVFNYINDNGVLHLVSDNTQYKAYTIEPTEVEEVWSAKAYLSLDFPENNDAPKIPL
jgi:transcriptional regulator with XRE-family HTH domain